MKREMRAKAVIKMTQRDEHQVVGLRANWVGVLTLSEGEKWGKMGSENTSYWWSGDQMTSSIRASYRKFGVGLSGDKLRTWAHAHAFLKRVCMCITSMVQDFLSWEMDLQRQEWMNDVTWGVPGRSKCKIILQGNVGDSGSRVCPQKNQIPLKVNF